MLGDILSPFSSFFPSHSYIRSCVRNGAERIGLCTTNFWKVIKQLALVNTIKNYWWYYYRVSLFQTVSDACFRPMFVILHDNMRNTRDINQAVNRTYKFVHFLLCSLPWINGCNNLGWFLHHMCDGCVFFKTKWRHPGKDAIWTSLASSVWNDLSECMVSVYLHWTHFCSKTYCLSGFVSRLYAEHCFCWVTMGAQTRFLPTPTPPSLVNKNLSPSFLKVRYCS